MTKDTFPMNIGGEKVRSERMLLAKVEDGKNMMSADSIKFLVLHCSASRCDQDYSVEQLRRDHKARVSIRSTPYCISQKNVVTLHGGIIFLILRQEYEV